MTRLFEQAIAKVRDLPASEQDALAQLLLAEIEAEKKWDELFARAPQKLTKLADQAWADHEAGRTLPLNPETL